MVLAVAWLSGHIGERHSKEFIALKVRGAKCSRCRNSMQIPPRPLIPGGAGLLSVAVAAGVGARPDEAEGLFAAFDHRVVEEVGVDRRGEARVVEFEAQVVAAFGRAFGPGGADLGTANEDAVRGGVFVRGAVLGDDADGFRLHAQGDDFADVFAAGFLEGSDGGHVISPFWLVRARALRGLDGDHQDRGDPPTQPLWPAAPAEDGKAGLSCRARNGDPLFGGARGRKSGRAVAAKAVEASADPGQISR